ncbi:MAG: OprD family outer membrane porin, partial [Pseudomonas sp.]
MKLSSTAILALAISSITATAYAETQSQAFTPVTVNTKSAQAEATGFVEGQSITGSTRNWYANEEKKRGGTFNYERHGDTLTGPRRINWVQGTILNYTSGFTQGTVGFSTEVAAYNAIALDRSREDIKGGSNRTLAHSNGDAVDQW